jgi:CRISPR-associated protein Cmr3
MIDNKLFFPRPADAVVRDDNGRMTVLSIRPRNTDQHCGCDLPTGLIPALLPNSTGDDFKPVKAPAFWSIARMTEWLTDETALKLATEPFEKWSNGYIETLPQEERTHVKITPEAGAASNSELFSTCALDFSRTVDDGVVRMALRVEPASMFDAAVGQLDALHPCGGERRLVSWKGRSKTDWYMPGSLNTSFEKADREGHRRVRLILGTPGLFEDDGDERQGWKPGWLRLTAAGSLEGSPPGASLTLRLVSAVVDRWRPISGWSLERGTVGPKPVRRMVPAGATYFFEAIGEGPLAQITNNLWLRSVCDKEQDRLDGFGLALWGLWNEHPTGKA